MRLRMAPPDHVCLKREWDRNCQNDWCPNYIPAVEGDLFRRYPICARAIDDAAPEVGGFSYRSIGWLCSKSHTWARKTVERGLARMKEEAEQWR